MTVKQIFQTFLFSLACIWAYQATAEVEPLDSVIAVVNDDAILASELERKIQTVRINMQGRQLPPIEILKQEVLESLIVENIQLQAAERMGVRVSDQEVNMAMENIAKQKNMSLGEYRNHIEKSGISYNLVRAQVRKEISIDHLRRAQLNQRIRVSDKEVDEYLASEQGQQQSEASYLVNHVAIGTPKGMSDSDKSKQFLIAQQVSLQLNSGSDLSTFQDLYNAQRLGWKTKDELPDLFVQALDKLKIGGASEPIRTSAGYHILQLADKRGGKSRWVKQKLSQHILIRPNEIRSEYEAKRLIENLHKRIKNGEDFSALAQAYSDDPGSASKGGQLGWTDGSEFVPEFKATLKKLNNGQMSEPFKTQYGWHIMRVLEDREFNVGQLVLQNQAKQYLQSLKFKDELEIWLQELRSNAYVEIKVPELDKQANQSTVK